MLWQPATVLALLAAASFIVPGQVQADEGARTGTWKHEHVAAGDIPASTASFSVVDRQTRGDGMQRLSPRGSNGETPFAIEVVADRSEHLMGVRGEPNPGARDGALSSLIGDRQGLAYLLQWLFGSWY